MKQSKIISLNASPIIQVSFDDLQRIIDLKLNDRMVKEETAAAILDCSKDTVRALAAAKKINIYYDTRDTVTRNLFRYKYSELMGTELWTTIPRIK